MAEAERTGSEQTLADRFLIGIPCIGFGVLLHWAMYMHAPNPLTDITSLGIWLIFSCWQAVANLFFLIAAIKFFGRTGWINDLLLKSRRSMITLFIAITAVTSLAALLAFASRAGQGV